MADEPNLFGVRHRKKVERPKTPTGAMTKLIGQYKAGYERRFSEPPVVTKRDGQMLKTLVLKFGEQTVAERLAAYLAWDDRFAEESGFAINTFYNSWSRLTAYVKQRQRRPAGNGNVPGVAETDAYLDSLRARKNGHG